MVKRIKSRLAMATIVVALLGGGTAVALGADGGGGPGSRTLSSAGHRSRGARHDSLLAVAARYLGVSRAQLRSQLTAGRSLAEIAGASPGHSSSGLLAKLVSTRDVQLSERITMLIARPGGGTASRAGRLSARSAAISYLGLSRRELRSRLRSGSSLGQIADQTAGRSAAGLVDAIVAAARARLQGAVAAGRLTAAEQAPRLARVREHATALVERTPRRSSRTH